MCASLHLTGHALVYADQLIGLRMFINDVVKVRMLCGKQHFKKQLQFEAFATVPTDEKTSATRATVLLGSTCKVYM